MRIHACISVARASGTAGCLVGCVGLELGEELDRARLKDLVVASDFLPLGDLFGVERKSKSVEL